MASYECIRCQPAEFQRGHHFLVFTFYKGPGKATEIPKTFVPFLGSPAICDQPVQGFLFCSGKPLVSWFISHGTFEEPMMHHVWIRRMGEVNQAKREMLNSWCPEQSKRGASRALFHIPTGCPSAPASNTVRRSMAPSWLHPGEHGFLDAGQQTEGPLIPVWAGF